MTKLWDVTGILALLTSIVLGVLKLTHVIEITWLYVLLPIVSVVTLILVGIGVAFLVSILYPYDE